MVNEKLIDYYRRPESFIHFTLSGPLCQDSGFFRFGQDAICYGQSSAGSLAKLVADQLYDVSADVNTNKPGPCLQFDPGQIIENLRYERYCSNSTAHRKELTLKHPLVRST